MTLLLEWLTNADTLLVARIVAPTPDVLCCINGCGLLEVWDVIHALCGGDHTLIKLKV